MTNEPLVTTKLNHLYFANRFSTNDRCIVFIVLGNMYFKALPISIRRNVVEVWIIVGSFSYVDVDSKSVQQSTMMFVALNVTIIKGVAHQ